MWMSLYVVVMLCVGGVMYYHLTAMERFQCWEYVNPNSYVRTGFADGNWQYVTVPYKEGYRTVYVPQEVPRRDIYLSDLWVGIHGDRQLRATWVVEYAKLEDGKAVKAKQLTTYHFLI